MPEQEFKTGRNPKMDGRWEIDLYRGDAGYIDLLPN
jgi:hypothetical protein